MMATVERKTRSTEGVQKEKLLASSEEDSPSVVNDTSSQLNFSELTPCQFGISVQSFTPASLSKSKEKSRLAQLKARRRSNIGVRGSPETNSLICFMARQRMKTPPTFQTPELVRSSPFLPRVASTLKQKMASFQNLMDVEESEVCDPMPRQDRNTGGCIKTRDYLSDGYSCDGGKENHPPLMTPTPSKRRCLRPLEPCQLEIRETSAPILHLSLEQEEDKEPVTQAVTEGLLPSSEAVEEAQAVLISPLPHVDLELQDCSPAKNQQQDCVFELQSPSKPPPDASAAASPARPSSSFRIPSLPSLLEMKPTGEDDSTETSKVKNKKKSVRFGVPLSPEFFDKNLPPSTPLQKGGTPARAPTPGGSLKLRSLLKTPQRSESQTPQSQPDLNSPTAFGASPTLAMPRNRRMHSVGDDSEEEDGKIVFPSMEEIDSAVACDTESTWDTERLNLNTAFQEESLSQSLTESDAKPSITSQMDAQNELTSVPGQEKQLEAPAQTRNRRKKRPRPELESSNEAPARSGSRKRKPEESEPVKRSTRSAAKSASGKIKMTSTARRQWSKDVDRSLYSSRAYASKNPTLSPITERLSLIGQSPATQQTPSTGCTAPNHENHLNPEITNDSQTTAEPTLIDALKNPSEDSITSPNSSKDSTAGMSRRLSGPRLKGSGLKKRKVSVAELQTGGAMEEHCEDQNSTSLEVSRETLLTHAVPHQGGADMELNVQTSAATHCTDSEGKLECDVSTDAPSLDCPPSGEESNNAEPAQRKNNRRSSANSSHLQEQGNQVEEHQTSHEVGERPAAGQQENTIRSSSDGQEEEGATSLDLAPWQADFNFEDVFKPVATRGQRSVRRSLRNQSTAEHSAGLAWLPWSSPESSKEARRRTRGRRLSAAPPVQPSLPEETLDEAS
ncbi:cell division cycle-associated protein 2 isoform X3 [Sparus aurata]|uniref:cell division cycle-associated protein 2 isoform X3 n=1 Tax=Sparus aurata TaxID=8175 RepID=UPI0011C15F69|nr:cell division cycle-associated protein 2 isoform X3 [Sparus aurata]